MWLNEFSYGQFCVALLLFCYDFKPTSATNLAQLKNQQHALGQTSTTSIQQQQQQQPQHPHHVSSQTQQQLHQQTQQSGGIVAHPTNGLSMNSNSVVHASNTGNHNTEAHDLFSSMASSPATKTAATLAPFPSSHYVVHDKELAMQEIFKHFNTDASTYFNDQYQILNELKRETHDNAHHTQPPPPPPPFVSLHSGNMAYPWNLYGRTYAPFALPSSKTADLFSHNFNPFEAYSTPFPVSPRLMPVMSYPPSVYVPYPFIMPPPDMFYPSYTSLPQMANDFEDVMSRGAGSSRRSGTNQHSSSFPRNSPIFYMRLPPSPYMFLPGTSTVASFPNLIPYQSLPSFPSFSSVFNVPINFLANGKPTNIYQMSTPPNEIQNSLQFSNMPTNFNARPPPPPLTNVYIPAPSSHNYFNLPTSFPSSSSSNYASYPVASTGSESSASTPTLAASATLSQSDSKLTALKRPYYFNGRPEDIYILPNDFNPLYSSEGSYY